MYTYDITSGISTWHHWLLNPWVGLILAGLSIVIFVLELSSKRFRASSYSLMSYIVWPGSLIWFGIRMAIYN